MNREVPDQGTRVFDREELVTRCLGNLAFAERILAKFQSRVDVDITELEQAVLAEDVEAVARVAHRLKGASASAAAYRLQERAARLEQSARQSSLAEIPAQFAQLRCEWSRFVESASQVGGRCASTGG
jgi:HPt (histidine-containing phosphotransfer) domain-containing protein